MFVVVFHSASQNDIIGERAIFFPVVVHGVIQLLDVRKMDGDESVRNDDAVARNPVEERQSL